MPTPKPTKRKKLDDDDDNRSTTPTSADAGRDQTTTTAALESGGAITTAAVTTSSDPTVVQIIDTTKWSKPSPDPSGMAFIPGATPGTDTLLMSDSEIDETPFFRPDNLFYMSATGTFDHSASLESFTKEATGIVFNSQNGHLFISDDDKRMIFEIDPDNPGVPLSSFSTKGFALDPEDIGYDPATNHLFIVNGSGGGAAVRTIFETTLTGAIVDSVVLPTVISDPEAIAYDPASRLFYVSGGFSADIWVVSRDTQTIVDTITILENFRNPISGTRVHAKGLVLAPSSNPNDDASVMSLWVADYGNDQVMDGRIFEIQLSGATSIPPLFTSGNDTVNFNQISAGTYQAGTQYDALGGNDTVTLAVNADAAAAAGFDPAQTFDGGDGNDVITGGTLNDRVSGGNGNDVINGGDGNDTLAGNSNADTLGGGAGNDSLNGGSSADTLVGGLGDDLLDGGSGNDTVNYAAAAGAVTVNLALGTATGEGSDTLLNVENVIGSDFNDTITGNGVANVLTGGLGNDTLHGGDANDTLTGSAGNDTLHGGDANDTLTGSAGIDQLFGDGGHDTLKWDNQDSFDGGDGFDTLDANLSSADTIDLRGANFANLERIRTGSGKDIVTLSLNDVLSDTVDHQFVADLGSSSPDTLKIDTSGGWSETTPNTTLGDTGKAAGISVSGMTAHTFADGLGHTVTIFTNAEVVTPQDLSV
jgi:Ca2+-binding RTX toxin-like protein